MPERPQRVLDVGGDALEPWQSALRADRFRGLGETSGRQHRQPSRFLGLHAAPNVLGGRHVDVGLQLLAKLVVGAVFREDAGNAREGGAEVSHGVSRFGARKAEIRSAVWCHSRVSRANCFRPAAVSA